MDNYCQGDYYRAMISTRPKPAGPAKYRDLRQKLLPTGAILHAHLALSRLFETDVAEKTIHDPTTLDLLLRVRFAPHGGIRAVKLCEQLQKSASHVSRLVERAESARLVERRADPSDRRAQLIVLTNRGKKDLDAYIPHVVAIVDRVIFATLSGKEIELLVKLLTRVENASRRFAVEREG